MGKQGLAGPEGTTSGEPLVRRSLTWSIVGFVMLAIIGLIAAGKLIYATIGAVLLALVALGLAVSDVRRAVRQRDRAVGRQQESASMADSLFYTAAQAIVIVDRDGRIVMANPATEKMFGYTMDELTGKSVDTLLPSRLQNGHQAHRQRYFSNPQNRPMGLGMDLEARRKDGSEFFAEISLSYIPAAEGTLAVAFVTDISRRRADEQAIRRQKQELQQLAISLMTAQENERRRIARDLHDDLSQTLAYLSMDLGKLASSAPSGEPAAQLRSLQMRATEAAEAVRKVSHQLHPSVLDDIGLVAALEQYCEEFEERAGIPTHFAGENVPDEIPQEVASSVYYIAQECLRNVVKHARAEAVSVTVEGMDSRLRLVVKDQGIGVSEEQTAVNKGIGMVAMRERAQLINGKLSVVSAAGQGTEVRLEVSLDGSAGTATSS
jgi:PAS domain S-box-containing protein